eukprot:Gb_21874 [translate_table: standard]
MGNEDQCEDECKEYSEEGNIHEKYIKPVFSFCKSKCGDSKHYLCNVCQVLCCGVGKGKGMAAKEKVDMKPCERGKALIAWRCTTHRSIQVNTNNNFHRIQNL